MKTWEEAEFEMQQESIRKWARKKYFKMIDGWLLNRKLDKLQRLARIISGDNDVIAYIGLVSIKEKEDQKCKK